MKYIIDVPFETTSIHIVQQSLTGSISMKVISTSELTPYTEPDRKQIENGVWEFAKEVDRHTDDWDWFDMTYEEARDTYRDKYEVWKKQKDEIKVGDEVIINGLQGVVLRLDKNGNIDCWFTSDGITFGNSIGFLNRDIEKTGCHFPQVEELLKAMKGESDDD